MNVTGIVVEYNPLHNGHLLHIQNTKKLTQCDFIVAVMSGNFVQRGEPAILNKWARTKMALNAGVDLVLELPFIYSISSAEGFAFGSVALLNSLGIINNICFGSESGNIKSLMDTARILSNEPEAFKIILHKYLKEGLSYPAAVQKSLTDYIINKNNNNVNINDVEKVIFTPNNILAIEYIKSLIKLSSNITPFTINRLYNNYNDTDISGKVSSATSVRNNMNNQEIIKECIPDFTLSILNEEINLGRSPIRLEDFNDIILYKLRKMKLDEIRNLIDVREGLEYKIKSAADMAGDIRKLIELVKNKRYTVTRLQRILLYALFDMNKDIQQEIKSPPDYARILGFNSKGKILLKEIKKMNSIKLITNPSVKDISILKYDVMATDIYSIAYKNNSYKNAKQDLINSPVII